LLARRLVVALLLLPIAVSFVTGQLSIDSWSFPSDPAIANGYYYYYYSTTPPAPLQGGNSATETIAVTSQSQTNSVGQATPTATHTQTQSATTQTTTTSTVLVTGTAPTTTSVVTFTQVGVMTATSVVTASWGPRVLSIPGFPFESILGGLVIALALLAHRRRRK